jgi:DNA-binding response OmpR family regulator
LWKDRRVRLAVVEDDDGVGDALVEALNARGYRAERKRRGADLLIAHRDYDAVILDLGLPDGDGLQVLRRLREVSSVPVVILTARSDERSIVRGLRGGADDYLVKPPRIAELVARLETVTRRAAAAAQQAQTVVVTGDVRVDLGARVVEVAGAPVPLTQKEFELVEALVERPGAAVSRQQLMDRIWGDAFVAVSRSLDVHMTGLRAKLNRPGLITTIRGYGYRWGE